jgi:hypothetical protein
VKAITPSAPAGPPKGRKYFLKYRIATWEALGTASHNNDSGAILDRALETGQRRETVLCKPDGIGRNPSN